MIIWLILAAVTWFALMGFTNFVLWDDDPVAILIGMIIAAAICILFWPFVWLAGIGSAIHEVRHR
jgi:amino acid transporter